MNNAQQGAVPRPTLSTGGMMLRCKTNLHMVETVLAEANRFSKRIPLQDLNDSIHDFLVAETCALHHHMHTIIAMEFIAIAISTKHAEMP